MDSHYDSPRVAASYAYERPPVHAHILKRMGDDLGIATPVPWALDIGCGAGRSTAALGPFAERVVGIDPSPVMLAHGRAVAPGALFTLGEADRLPFAAGTFHLITAAGSINYADLTLCLPDAARVLAPGGTIAIYDFSLGRRLRESHRLEEWYQEFERRYPQRPGYDLDVRRLDYGHSGLRLDAYQEIEIAISTSPESYLTYAMTESGVELAIARGVSESEIRDWCRRTLGTVFGEHPHDVIFDAYAAYVRRDGPLNRSAGGQEVPPRPT